MDAKVADQAAVALRNFLKNQSSYHGAHSPSAIYSKIERALSSFLCCKPLSKVYEASEELFPLPEEGGDGGQP